MVLLRKLREEKGLSTIQVEKETGVGRSTILNIENKHYKSSNDKLQKLADFFGIKDPLDLIKNIDKKTSIKKCLNQRCELNKRCFCQSDQVCDGAYCQSENLITDKPKKSKFNRPEALSID